MDAAAAETPPPENAKPWEAVEDGEYAIVELFGHTTLVGRVAEVERFGAKMLALEPIFAGKLMGPIYHGGAAIYRLTPCSRQIAWERQHKEGWSLPPTIRAVAPPALIIPPMDNKIDLFGGDEEEHY